MDSGWEANFSFFHSSLRMSVECAFGMLVQRWGCLWRPLRSTLRHNILVVHACAIVHNWCIDNGVPVVLQPPSGEHSVLLENRPYMDANGVPRNMLGDDNAAGAGVLNPTMGQLRATLANRIRDEGMRRPVPAGVFEREGRAA